MKKKEKGGRCGRTEREEDEKKEEIREREGRVGVGMEGWGETVLKRGSEGERE